VIRIPDSLRWSALAVLISACGSDGRMAGPNPLEQDFLAIVSDPMLVSSAQLGAAADAPGPVAWVSLAPGTVPNAQSANIRNLRSGAAVVVPIVAGGFDPIAVPAEPGDTLEISVASGAVTLKGAFPVPVRIHPIVVRTDPPPQKRDVPLNASIVVVFSEPIDPGTLSANSVQLKIGAITVAGTLGLVPGKPSTALFTPAAPLDAGTTYDLLVTQDIRDLSGDQLEAAVQVSFTTVSATPGSSLTSLWGMVVDETGVCIVGATALVVHGQGLGQSVEQTTPCDAWAYDGGFVFKHLTPGVEMTLRVSAPGFIEQERTVVPSLGPQTAVLFAPSRTP
jgi:hypothetical protein